MNQNKRTVSMAEFEDQAALLSKVDTFRLQLLPRLESQVEVSELQAVETKQPDVLVWSAMVHHTLGENHYFAFSDGGLAVYSPVTGGGYEIQLDLSIGLGPDTLKAVGEAVCAAIQTYGPFFDNRFVGIQARVVPKRINLGFAVKASK